MKIAVGLLVVGVLVVGLAFADPNPPNYGHYYHYTYTVLFSFDFFPLIFSPLFSHSNHSS